MLEPPEIPAELILSRLQEAFGLSAGRLTFLPLGADVNTAVYRADCPGGAYFLKLRKGSFDEASLAVPRFLYAQGLQAIISPLPALDGRLWGELDAYKMILYPFVEGQDGYQGALTEPQWREFGAAVRRIHAARLPAELRQKLAREDFSPRWRDEVRLFQRQVRQAAYTDPVARDLAAFLDSHRDVIARLVDRADALARSLQPRFLQQSDSLLSMLDSRLSSPDSRFTTLDSRLSPLSPVLCHSDLHPGNLHLAPDGRLYIVDWDAPLLAPKERDLALIGGNGRVAWRSPAAEALFYRGYGPARVERAALAYYRCERVIQDIAAFSEQLLWSDSGGEDRRQSYLYLTSSFEPGSELDVALNS